MTDIAPLLTYIGYLCDNADSVIEASHNLVIEGCASSASLTRNLRGILHAAASLGIPAPTVWMDGQTVNDEELADYDGSSDASWKLVFGKTELAKQLRARDTETTVLFFSINRFDNWLKGLDPFVRSSQFDPDFCSPTTIRVAGLEYAFGGPSLWILPVTDPPPSDIAPIHVLPESEAVHDLIHINANRVVTVSPKGWVLTWGKIDQMAAIPLVRLGAMVLSVCLTQELKLIDNEYTVTLRGTKRLSLHLAASDDSSDSELLRSLIKAVEWVYEEKPETRLKLIMDRLSIDIEPEQTLLSGAQLHIEAALQQAKDSYAFVILDRKDAYHKEMRELMKDMRSQADLYAAKVRDMVSSLTRDMLGLLAFIGFSFIGKFDHSNLEKLLSSHELSLLTKVFSGYLFLSCILQLATHWRDASLAYEENRTWLSMLQNYTSRKDLEERCFAPIKRRRRTMWFAMAVTSLVYLLLALLVWCLPFVIKLLLAQFA